jgi:hypothetical protein
MSAVVYIRMVCQGYGAYSKKETFNINSKVFEYFKLHMEKMVEKHVDSKSIARQTSERLQDFQQTFFESFPPNLHMVASSTMQPLENHSPTKGSIDELLQSLLEIASGFDIQLKNVLLNEETGGALVKTSFHSVYKECNALTCTFCLSARNGSFAIANFPAGKGKLAGAVTRERRSILLNRLGHAIEEIVGNFKGGLTEVAGAIQPKLDQIIASFESTLTDEINNRISAASQDDGRNTGGRTRDSRQALDRFKENLRRVQELLDGLVVS